MFQLYLASCISISDQVKPEVREQRDLLIQLTVVKTEQSRSGKQPKDALWQAVCLSLFVSALKYAHIVQAFGLCSALSCSCKCEYL